MRASRLVIATAENGTHLWRAWRNYRGIQFELVVKRSEGWFDARGEQVTGRALWELYWSSEAAEAAVASVRDRRRG